MTRRAEIERRAERLREISDVMTAMKNLALVETRKLARFVGHQQQMLAQIAAVAADFLRFFPVATPAPERALMVVIGSERGFCGNFNDRILSALPKLPHVSPPRLLVVGRRLATKLGEDPRIAASLDGPTVVEDVPGVLDGLMDALHETRQHVDGRVALWALAHDADGDPEIRRLLPITSRESPRLGHPPRLQVAPETFFAQLAEQYLMAALHGLFYGSLVAENRRRMEHMEHALRRLDEMLAALTIKRSALRQEEIVEEIEVIMLSAELLPSSERRKREHAP